MNNKYTITLPEDYFKKVKEKMLTRRGELKIGSIRSSEYLADKIIANYNKKLETSTFSIDRDPMSFVTWDEGEIRARIDRNIAGSDYYLFGGVLGPVTIPSINDNLMELFITIRALKENRAANITVIIPYLAYSRSDAPSVFQREAITAKLIADFIEYAGATEAVIYHPHSRQEKGFFNIPSVIIDPFSFYLKEYSQFKNHDNVILVAPDAGASKLIIPLAEELNLAYAIASKIRTDKGIKTQKIIGDFDGKDTAILIDDLIATGGTLIRLILKLYDEFNIKQIYAGCSHFLGNPKAIGGLINAHNKHGLVQLLSTDSIPLTKPVRNIGFFNEKSLDETFTYVIDALHNEKSISSAFYRPSE